MNKINVKLIIGLGNPARLNSRSGRPGKEYENTRHNTGFIFIDELAKQLKTADFKYEKSQTFMNNSGSGVLALIRNYHPTGDHPKGGKIKPENILIIHDDIDILWGKFKFSFGRSSAGHKGVESVIKALKTKNFWRLRIGIQPTFAKATASKPTPKKHISADKIILKKFTPAELKILNQTIKKAIIELGCG